MAVLRSLAGPHRRLPSRFAARRSRCGSSGRSAEHRRQPGLPRRASPVLEATAFGDLFTDARSTLFYNMPFRVFEFSLGALVLWLPALRRGVLQEMLLAVGLLSIGYSVANYRANMLFDPLNPLLPCVGAALTLYAGKATGLRAPAPQCAGGLCRAHQLFRLSRPLAADRLHRIPLLAPHAPAGSRAWHSVAGAGQRHVPPHRSAIPQGPCRHRTLRDRSARIGARDVADRAGRGRREGSDCAGAGPRGRRAAAGGDDDQGVEGCRGQHRCEDPCEFGNAGGPRVLIVGNSHVDHYTKALDTLAGSRIHFLLAYSPACFFGANYERQSDTRRPDPPLRGSTQDAGPMAGGGDLLLRWC